MGKKLVTGQVGPNSNAQITIPREGRFHGCMVVGKHGKLEKKMIVVLAIETQLHSFIDRFVKIAENWKPLGYYYYKCKTQDVFCIPFNPQLMKIWKIKFETPKPHFLN